MDKLNIHSGFNLLSICNLLWEICLIVTTHHNKMHSLELNKPKKKL